MELKAAPETPLSVPRTQRVPFWQLLLLIAFFVGIAILSAMATQPDEPPPTNQALALYLPTIVLQWLLLVYVCWSDRSLFHELVGKTSWRLFAIDLLAATAALVLILAASIVLPEGDASSIVPHGALEKELWVLVALTAGICEEAIFRGYLQRQLAIRSGSLIAAIILQAALFGISHGYQGWQGAVQIGVVGLLFGALAEMRKSLRPGMLAHTAMDILGGFLR